MATSRKTTAKSAKKSNPKSNAKSKPKKTGAKSVAPKRPTAKKAKAAASKKKKVATVAAKKKVDKKAGQKKTPLVKGPVKRPVKKPVKGAVVAETGAGRAALAWSDFVSPVGDRVLLVADKVESMTAGGIVIPGSAQQESLRATVVAVGPGGLDKKGRRKALDVRVGDQVLYQKYAGDQLVLRGEPLLLLREGDIIAVLT